MISIARIFRVVSAAFVVTFPIWIGIGLAVR